VTFATKNAAVRDARHLAAKLNAHYGVNSFTPRWNENIGWHSCARSKNLHVWEPRKGSFCCLVGEDGCGCGIWQSGAGSNPITAIRRAIDNASASLGRYIGVVASACAQLNQDCEIEIPNEH